MSNVAVILIRGMVGAKREVKDTLAMLNLQRKNSCVILPNKPEVIGMIDKAKDFVTWGEISDETVSLIKSKRDKGKKFFRLNSPKGGFERKGIKVPFNRGGVIGYRGDKVNDLIKRML